MPGLRGSLGRAVAAVDRIRPWRVFDRPIFLISPPRSGSTFLFDALASHPAVVSWPMEAQPAYVAARPGGHPLELGDRWPAAYASESLRRELSRQLYLGRLRAWRQVGRPRPRAERLALHPVRLLEKTPANVLRVEVLADVFPDARFVFLHRDAPATIGSLIEAWLTPTRAHATVHVGDRTVQWMMLAPPGWLHHLQDPVPDRAAFQWRAGVEYALDALETLDPSRWVQLSYEELVAAPEEQLRRVLEFGDLGPQPGVLAAASSVGTAGRTSLSAPRADKWRDRADLIEPLLPALADVRARLGYVDPT